MLLSEKSKPTLIMDRKDNWIPITESLPEYTERATMWDDDIEGIVEYGEPCKQTVLAYNVVLGIYKAIYQKPGRWSEVSSISIKSTSDVIPTHWQPLLSPPNQ